jgi:hypothetical protein
MQHPYQSNLAANESGILCELLGCCGTGIEEEMVDLLLVLKSD